MTFSSNNFHSKYIFSFLIDVHAVYNNKYLTEATKVQGDIYTLVYL